MNDKLDSTFHHKHYQIDFLYSHLDFQEDQELCLRDVINLIGDKILPDFTERESERNDTFGELNHSFEELVLETKNYQNGSIFYDDTAYFDTNKKGEADINEIKQIKNRIKSLNRRFASAHKQYGNGELLAVRDKILNRLRRALTSKEINAHLYHTKNGEKFAIPIQAWRVGSVWRNFCLAQAGGFSGKTLGRISYPETSEYEPWRAKYAGDVMFLHDEIESLAENFESTDIVTDKIKQAMKEEIFQNKDKGEKQEFAISEMMPRVAALYNELKGIPKNKDQFARHVLDYLSEHKKYAELFEKTGIETIARRLPNAAKLLGYRDYDDFIEKAVAS